MTASIRMLEVIQLSVVPKQVIIFTMTHIWSKHYKHHLFVGTLLYVWFTDLGRYWMQNFICFNISAESWPWCPKMYGTERFYWKKNYCIKKHTVSEYEQSLQYFPVIIINALYMYLSHNDICPHIRSCKYFQQWFTLHSLTRYFFCLITKSICGISLVQLEYTLDLTKEGHQNKGGQHHSYYGNQGG